MPPQPGHGPAYVRGTVTAVDPAGRYALHRDTLGKERQVTLSIQRTGLVPVQGERWLIDQTYGTWTFAARING